MSKRIQSGTLKAYITNLRSKAMDDCIFANPCSSETKVQIQNAASAKVKRQIANELEAILCGEN